ncbi:protein of unknown function [Shewanella benthica]|uniref:Uncharacterized protein n=1 Tax=Shewanella benthica TaxID=43661 RepID=A0A330M6I8_9GAMM|nr:protein of unknown function [Shewanella benthica]
MTPLAVDLGDISPAGGVLRREIFSFHLPLRADCVVIVS